MPDGYAGVVYSGAVYPLHEGDYINIRDEPLDKEDCDRFLPAYKDTPYAPQDGPNGGDDDANHLGIEAWYLESNQFGPPGPRGHRAAVRRPHRAWSHQPRSRHSSRCGRSAPRVVSSPCPG
jgi:hypothetical protein